MAGPVPRLEAVPEAPAEQQEVKEEVKEEKKDAVEEEKCFVCGRGEVAPPPDAPPSYRNPLMRCMAAALSRESNSNSSSSSATTPCFPCVGGPHHSRCLMPPVTRGVGPRTLARWRCPPCVTRAVELRKELREAKKREREDQEDRELDLLEAEDEKRAAKEFSAAERRVLRCVSRAWAERQRRAILAEALEDLGDDGNDGSSGVVESTASADSGDLRESLIELRCEYGDEVARMMHSWGGASAADPDTCELLEMLADEFVRDLLKRLAAEAESRVADAQAQSEAVAISQGKPMQKTQAQAQAQTQKKKKPLTETELAAQFPLVAADRASRRVARAKSVNLQSVVENVPVRSRERVREVVVFLRSTKDARKTNSDVEQAKARGEEFDESAATVPAAVPAVGGGEEGPSSSSSSSASSASSPGDEPKLEPFWERSAVLGAAGRAFKQSESKARRLRYRNALSATLTALPKPLGAAKTPYEVFADSTKTSFTRPRSRKRFRDWSRLETFSISLNAESLDVVAQLAYECCEAAVRRALAIRNQGDPERWERAGGHEWWVPENALPASLVLAAFDARTAELEREEREQEQKEQEQAQNAQKAQKQEQESASAAASADGPGEPNVEGPAPKRRKIEEGDS
jgi:hypothetical protein